MAKFIFVTGGVISGLGKGITAASLGRLLKARGFKVAAQKLDPYINVDPGTMSPLQHGEVFVTEDGAETDLDLGHYERFIDEDLNQFSNLTTGKVYSNVIRKERNGDYLGHTVQVIPHITNEIKDFIYGVQKKTSADIVITEIGGTVGDIESQPFLEAIRQVGQEVGPGSSLYIHVTLIPWLEASGEFKSKPTQHSVRELRSYGIFPNIIVTRSNRSVGREVLDKIALFCNVKKDCVIENLTLPSIYDAPLMLEQAGFAGIVMRELCLEPKSESTLCEWENMVYRIHHPERTVHIALVGKYTALHDAYLSVAEALKHGGWHDRVDVKIDWVDSEQLEQEEVSRRLRDADGIIVPGGFGNRGTGGMMAAARYARENGVPYFGICLGMQIAVIEFARDVLELADANSSEFNPETENPVIDLMPDQEEGGKKGGTMRLGAYPCVLTEGAKLHEIYREWGPVIRERHRHRYEFNHSYKPAFEERGMIIAGQSPDERLAEAVEIKDHPFYIGVQYHPEFKSRPNRPHPLFSAFIEASEEYGKKRIEEEAEK
ncbi:MAG: CTP synthase [Eubacteriales bacterium]|nr:CTP synthase [Eubacteriales bacterium]